VKSLLLSLLLTASGSGRWAIPTSAGGVLQNLDPAPRRPAASLAGAPAPAMTSELNLTITVRSRLDVTVVCRTRGAFFNQDLPRERPDPDQPTSECSQLAGEKGSERIEDTRTPSAGRKK
jgi:hypothetical protein